MLKSFFLQFIVISVGTVVGECETQTEEST